MQNLTQEPVVMDDFVAAMRRINKSVGADDIKRHVDWDREFGSA